MTRAQDDLRAGARKRYQALRRKQRDPRFRNVMDRFVAEGLLATTMEGIPLHHNRVPLEEALWAGTVEPRIMELLPAVLKHRLRHGFRAWRRMSKLRSDEPPFSRPRKAVTIRPHDERSPAVNEPIA